MEYQGTFRIEQKDNLRYNYFIARKKLWLGSIIVFFVILILTGLVRFGQSSDIMRALFQTLPFALGGAVLLFAVNLLAMYTRLRSMYKKRQIVPFTQQIRLDREGIHASSENGQNKLAWKHLAGVTEAPKDFILTLDAQTVYVLPKNQLAAPADVQKLRELFKAYAGKSAQRLRG